MQTIFIVGGAAIDITGKPENICRERDSNLGSGCKSTLAALGHNIAKPSCRATIIRWSSLTAIGSGFHAGMVRESCEQSANISLEAYAGMQAEHTGTYIGVFDEDGDMLVGISDMSVLDHLTPDYLAQPCLPQINASALCVIDGNLSPASLEYLCRNVTAPLFFDPVSCAKGQADWRKYRQAVLQSSQTGSKRASSPASPAIRFAESTAPPTGFWSRASNAFSSLWGRKACFGRMRKRLRRSARGMPALRKGPHRRGRRNGRRRYRRLCQTASPPKNARVLGNLASARSLTQELMSKT